MTMEWLLDKHHFTLCSSGVGAKAAWKPGGFASRMA
jgi:hypothetical protein